MKKLILIFLIIIFCATPSLAEMVADTAWVRTYNGPGNYTDIVYAIAVDNSGNVYVTGENYGSMWIYLDYCTIKYYSNGDTAWVRRYDGPMSGDDYAYAIAVDNSGNVYVTGASWGCDTSWDYLTIKYYPNGDTAWTRRYNGPAGADDIATQLAVDSQGNVYVTGASVGHGDNILVGYDYLTIKYYPNGDTAWTRRYDWTGRWLDDPFGLVLDELGNVYITGIACDTAFSNCVYITIKYFSNGITAWTSKYNDGFWAHNIAVDFVGNVYVTGEDDDINFATVKYDKSGNQLWARTYSGPGDCENIALALVVDDNQNVYVTGYSRKSWYIPYNCNYTTIKYDHSGNQVWLKTYGTLDSDDEPRAMAGDRFGNVYVTGVTGFSQNNGTTDNCGTIKYDSSGNQIWVQLYDGLEGLSDEAKAIAVDDSDNVYVGGYSYREESNRDYLIIKYNQHLRGDWNKDGFINISDAIFLLNYLYRQGDPPQPMEIGNINCDGVIDVGDVIYLINYMFRAGPEPSCT
jgi:hypothetical protein